MLVLLEIHDYYVCHNILISHDVCYEHIFPMLGLVYMRETIILSISYQTHSIRIPVAIAPPSRFSKDKKGMKKKLIDVFHKSLNIF